MKIPELRWPSEPSPYDHDLLLDIRVGTVVILIRGRNAWHSTWVRHYLRNSTLYTDVPSAKLGAESQRGPGNVFYIVEAPALLLRGMLSNVVLCDAHPDNPFGYFTGLDSTVTASGYGDWIDGVFPGVSVRDAATAFQHNSGHWSGSVPSEHSLRTGMLDSAHLFETTAHSMQSLVSRPIGSNYHLQWDPHSPGNRYTLSGASRVTERWAEIVAGVVQGASEPAARAEQLRRYREDVLRALPRSQWLSQKQRIEAEQRRARSFAEERWSDAYDRAAALEEALLEAEAEQTAAQAARMAPATTSAAVRAQRERVEAANMEVARLTVELATAEIEADELWTRYIQS